MDLWCDNIYVFFNRFPKGSMKNCPLSFLSELRRLPNLAFTQLPALASKPFMALGLNGTLVFGFYVGVEKCGVERWEVLNTRCVFGGCMFVKVSLFVFLFKNGPGMYVSVFFESSKATIGRIMAGILAGKLQGIVWHPRKRWKHSATLGKAKSSTTVDGWNPKQPPGMVETL